MVGVRRGSTRRETKDVRRDIDGKARKGRERNADVKQGRQWISSQMISYVTLLGDLELTKVVDKLRIYADGGRKSKMGNEHVCSRTQNHCLSASLPRSI